MGVADMREAVDDGPELLQPLFRGDAEALLLVDDEEPEIAEDDVLGEEAVRSDQDVDASGGEALENGLRLLRRSEARHHLDGDGKGGKPGAKGLPVLEGENGRGREDRHLLAVEDGAHGGSHGHLGLAVADVAEDETVHG